MKRLTINRIATASLRAHRRQYVSLALGIFLSIFMVCSMLLAAQGLVMASREQIARRVGYEDIVAFDEKFHDDAMLRGTGLFDRIGHVYVTAAVQDTGVYAGFYDEEGASLLARRCTAGRLPEKAGEIAAERSALEQMRVDIAVGDTIALDLMPISGVASEKRAYTLVGILGEQSTYLDVSQFTSAPDKVIRFPAFLLSDAEPPMESGRVAVHRVMTYTPGTTFGTVDQYGMEHDLPILYGVSEGGRLMFFSGQYPNETAERDETLLLLGLLGGTLIMASCVAIAGAMEGQIARKREEIGMLRAVGATKRQIRRIFGREAWTLALVVSPAAVACACLFAWGLSRFAPDIVAFAPSPFLIAPAVLLSVIVVFLASSLPLRRAGRTQPMSVLRDTAMLRKQKHFKSRNVFSVPRLISRRQIRLSPTRLIGSSLLVALMMFFISGFSSVLLSGFEEVFKGRADYEIYVEYSSRYSDVYADVFQRSTLSDQDIAQMSSLPHISRVDVTRKMWINADVGTATEYVKPQKYVYPFDNAGLLTEEEYLERADSPGGMIPGAGATHRSAYEAAQDVFGFAGDMVSMPLIVLPLDENELAPCVTQGTIDMKALDSGREVLLYAPDKWYTLSQVSDGSVSGMIGYNEPRSGALAKPLPNDQFSAGQALPIAQAYMFSDEEARSNYYSMTLSYDEAYAEYAAMHLNKATPVIGAVIGRQTSIIDIVDAPAVLTTEKGLRAMGLYAGSFDDARIYLSSAPDADIESYLTERLENIVLRAPGAKIFNKLEAKRERDSENLRSMLVLGSVTALFFAMSVALVVGNAARRVQADKRAIGTLRAVGADRPCILRCYAGQVVFSILAGVVLGAAGSAGLSLMNGSFSRSWQGTLIFQIFFLALILLSSICLLRARIRGVVHRSIVDNIREL